MNYKNEFIEFMVRSNVLSFGEFKTKSGRCTPYFINTGNYKTGEQISKLGDFYAQSIIDNIGSDFDLLFGPAYKGIPISVAISIALYKNFNYNISYFFNRKEVKEHGEGGNIIGCIPKDGNKVVIVEDVITAGTTIREYIPILNAIAKIEIVALIISVDRMEKGIGDKSTLEELQENYGFKIYPIINIKEIIEYLHNKQIDGKIIVDNHVKKQVENYLVNYGI